jgi:hypothetical protein
MAFPATRLAAAPDDPPPASTFLVTFDGLVVHDLYESHPKRALIVQGGAFRMRHAPSLMVPLDIDVPALRDATGQPVFCDKEHCRVLISRFDMQIGTSDLSRTPVPVSIDSTFDAVTPHLACVTKRTLSASVLSDLPDAPLAGRFELHDGHLSACPFDAPAYFLDDYDQEGPRYFADKVFLTGMVQADAVAVLQIRSAITHGKWMPISRKGTDRLEIMIMNHAPTPKRSTRHFALNEKLMSESSVPNPFPVVCPVVFDSSTDDVDKKCPPSGGSLPDANSDRTGLCALPTFVCPCEDGNCTGQAPMAVAVKASVQRAKLRNAATPSFEILPGCANSTWP